MLSVLLSAFGLGGIVYGIIESSSYGWVKAKMAYEIFNHQYSLGDISITTYAITFGFIFLGLFLLRQQNLERRGKVPLVSLALFRKRQFIVGTVVTMVAVMSQFGFVFALPVFFQGLLGKDAFHTGLAILPFSASILVGSPLSGVLTGKFNVAPRYLIQTGLALSAIGAFLLHQELSVTSTTATFVPGLIVFGFGFGLAFSQLANLTLSAVSVQQAGEASGVNNTFRQIGSSLGQAFIGAILISALATHLQGDITKSTIIPTPLKGQVTSSIAASAESLGTAESANSAQPMPLPIAREVVRIRNDAIVAGARTAMAGTVGAAILALLISTQLPKRSLRAEDLDQDAHA